MSVRIESESLSELESEWVSELIGMRIHTFGADPQTISIPKQNLESILGSVAKDEKMTAEGILLHSMLSQ